MKRSLILAVIIVTICALLLTGCSAPAPELRDNFEIDLAVSGDRELSAHVIRTPETLTVTVTSPATLAGLAYTYNIDELTVSYASCSSITAADALPEGAVPSILHETLYHLDRARYLSSDDSSDTFVLSTTSGDIQITLSDGLPVSIGGGRLPYKITTA